MSFFSNNLAAASQGKSGAIINDGLRITMSSAGKSGFNWNANNQALAPPDLEHAAPFELAAGMNDKD